MLGIKMQFTAKEINETNINPQLFIIPKGYNRVSKKEMESIVNEYNKVSDK